MIGRLWIYTHLSVPLTAYNHSCARRIIAFIVALDYMAITSPLLNHPSSPATIIHYSHSTVRRTHYNQIHSRRPRFVSVCRYTQSALHLNNNIVLLAYTRVPAFTTTSALPRVHSEINYRSPILMSICRSLSPILSRLLRHCRNRLTFDLFLQQYAMVIAGRQ